LAQLRRRFGADREHAGEALEVLAVWLHDVAAAKVGASTLANKDLAELATKRQRR